MLQELGLDDMTPNPSLTPAVANNSGAVGWASATPVKGKYEDTLDLSNELKNAAEQCQILADKLKKKGDQKLRASETRVESSTQSNSNNLDDALFSNCDQCCSQAKERLQSTLAENIRLRQVVKDVTDINKRWQKYNRTQQDYVQRLLAENRKLQEEKAEAEVEAILRRSDSCRTAQREEATVAKKLPKPLTFRHSDSSLIDNSSVVSALRQSYENAVKENCRLEKELDLAKAVEEALKLQVESSGKAHSEKLDLLDCQMKMHKEDWEAEKAEKEEAKAQNQKLTEELQQLKVKVRHYSDRLSLIEQTCRCTSVDCEFVMPSLAEATPGLRSLRRHQSFSPTRLNGRRSSWVCDGQQTPDFDNQRFLTRGGTTGIESKSRASEGSAKSAASRNDNGRNSLSRNESFQLMDLNSIPNDVLECPGCKREFPAGQHLHFLDHFEECQNEKR